MASLLEKKKKSRGTDLLNQGIADKGGFYTGFGPDMEFIIRLNYQSLGFKFQCTATKFLVTVLIYLGPGKGVSVN